MKPFPMLFDPIRIGGMEVKNRIVFPPIGTRFASVAGEVTQHHLDHFEARARGGAGLLIVPWVRVENRMERKTGRLRLDSDEYIRGLSRIADIVHLHDGKIAIQLSQGGRAVTREEAEGGVPVSASEAFCEPFGTKARSLSRDEIDYLIEAFAAASWRAKEAGFDAVEFHAASGYLISQFLSPFVNKRDDAYGGDPQRRMTFLLRIIERTRTRVGDQFPIMVRISADELIKGGLTLADSKFISRQLAEAGVSCIDVTQGIVESYHLAMPPMAVAPGSFVHLAAGIKEVVDIPVITVGRINDPILAEKILEEGKADLIAMGRALIADPDLPLKAAKGDLDKIRPCIACNRCEMATSKNIPIRCAVNPWVGKEKEYRSGPAAEKKRILVAGGGPGGMTAATFLAKQGHRVSLYERENELGGQLRLAARPPHKEELNRLLRYLESELRGAGVEIVLGKEVTEKIVVGLRPDAVVVAAGALPKKLVNMSEADIRTIDAVDVLRGAAGIEDKITVVGAGIVGCETAEFLAAQGREVTIIEILPEIASDMEPFSKILLQERLRQYGVKIFISAKIGKAGQRSLEVIDAAGVSRIIEVGTVVNATGSQPDTCLFTALQGKIANLFLIGDCRKPQGILEAIHEGTQVAFFI